MRGLSMRGEECVIMAVPVFDREWIHEMSSSLLLMSHNPY